MNNITLFHSSDHVIKHPELKLGKLNNDYGQGFYCTKSEIAVLFVQSGYAQQFERGNPSIVSGHSGIELAIDVLYYAYREERAQERRYSQERSPEYWAGWALAEFQWHSGRRFIGASDERNRIINVEEITV